MELLGGGNNNPTDKLGKGQWGRKDNMEEGWLRFMCELWNGTIRISPAHVSGLQFRPAIWPGFELWRKCGERVWGLTIPTNLIK